MKITDLIPPGGDWECVAPQDAICRTIMWRGKEVAYMNPAGDFTDEQEANLAMGMAAAPVCCTALREILKRADSNSEIAEIARLAIAYIGRSAPALVIEEEDEDYDDLTVDARQLAEDERRRCEDDEWNAQW